MATGHSLEASAERPTPPSATTWNPRGLSHLRLTVVPGTPRISRQPRACRASVLLSEYDPPFYYLLLYGWTRALGTGDAVLRLFSVLCSLGCFPVLCRSPEVRGQRRRPYPPASGSPSLPYAFSIPLKPHVFVVMLISVCTCWRPSAMDKGPSALRVRPLGRGVRCGFCSLITSSFFGLDRRGFLAAVSSRPVPTVALGRVLPDRLADLPWYRTFPRPRTVR